jgi:DNA-binding CsgD family transcriptional regulator
MRPGPALDNLVAAIEDACHAQLDLPALRDSVLPRLRRAVPIDALWWASVDPATLLFTQAYREEIPESTGPYFVENEFLRSDVNRWTEVAREPGGVKTLIEATGGRSATSARYRDVFEPLGLEDELRAVLRTQGSVWGFLCLHREAGARFSTDEARLIRRIAPHIAEGMRLGLLVQTTGADVTDGPGLLLLAADGSVISANLAADHWLEELRGPADTDLPIEIRALATQLRDPHQADPRPRRVRVRTRTGRWAVLHASWMTASDRRAVAVIIEQATPEQLTPIVMDAYGLTHQERALSALVFQGLSTAEISARLHITEHTVQDHLKSIFDKTGVRSRRELVATVLRKRYLPRARAGDPIGPSGYFVER